MRKAVDFVETVFTALEPERTLRVADESLVEIRLIESRKEGAAWIYEYEVKSEFGKIEKFLRRIRAIETGHSADGK